MEKITGKKAISNLVFTTKEVVAGGIDDRVAEFAEKIR